MTSMSREFVERFQFNGLYQLSSESPCSSCQTATVKSAMYRTIKMIGKGSFGRVYLVQEKLSGKDLAMKVMEKDEVLKTSEPEHIAQERRILASINFPFIVSYESHFQTKTKLCLVMEYVEGPNLYELLRSKAEGRFDEKAVRFFLSEILLSLEYLHHLDLIYRDMKLDNILIDRTGHVKMVDFGLSRLLAKDEKCRTFCGTPQYLAPEILQGRNYMKSVDWWAFGILAYELSVGKLPFGLPGNYPEQDMKNIKEDIQKKIEPNELEIPEFVELELVDLLEKLLHDSPSERLGSQTPVRNHDFFAQVNFEQVYRKMIKPPFTPKIREYKGPVGKVTKLGDEKDPNDNDFQDF